MSNDNNGKYMMFGIGTLVVGLILLLIGIFAKLKNENITKSLMIAGSSIMILGILLFMVPLYLNSSND